MQAQLAALRADAERREAVRLKLEYELTLASKAALQVCTNGEGRRTEGMERKKGKRKWEMAPFDVE